MQNTLTAIESLSSKPSGLLKIPINFGKKYLAPILCDFMNIYPEIMIDLRLSNAQSDIINGKFDLVLRGAGYLHHGYLTENNLIAKKVLSSSIILCACPALIQGHKKIRTLDDLQGLLGIDFDPSNLDIPTSDILWKIKGDTQQTALKLKKQFCCDDIDATIKMACAGYGIVKVAEMNVSDELKTKSLIKILPTINFGEYNLSDVFPQRHLPQRTRKLLEFFEQHQFES